MDKRNEPAVLNTDYLADFSTELLNIDKLEQTPMLMKQIAIQALDSAIDTPGIQTTVRNILQNNRQILENISSKSINDNFKIIYAQMCILSVSSLEATLKKYFENVLNGFNEINLNNKELETTKITLAELAKNNFSYRDGFGSLVLEKAKLNFQDLQAIKRNFENYLSKSIALDSDIEKKICFYLEIRHVLVHRGGIIDKKFVDATNLFGANVKKYTVGNHIEVNDNDWQEIRNCFVKLVEQVTLCKSRN